LSCLIKLNILQYYPIGTKIGINDNSVSINDPSILQGAFRFFKGDGSGLENVTIAQTATVQRSFTASSTWVAIHNFNTPNAIAQVYDTDGYQIIPSTLRHTDNNTITITFESARSGYVVIAKGGHIVSGSIDSANITGFSTAVTNQVNALGIFSGSAQITLSGDVTGTANASVISSIDGGSI
jgi:hypothetical protein